MDGLTEPDSTTSNAPDPAATSAPADVEQPGTGVGAIVGEEPNRCVDFCVCSNCNELEIDNESEIESESEINIWEREKMLNSSNIDTILVPLKKGSVLFLPAYWWYSIRFPSAPSSVALFSYRTFINTLAILPQLGKKFIQSRNTTYKIESKK